VVSIVRENFGIDTKRRAGDDFNISRPGTHNCPAEDDNGSRRG